MKGKTRVRIDQTNKRFKAGYYDNLFEEDGIIPYGIMVRLSNDEPKHRWFKLNKFYNFNNKNIKSSF